MYKKKYPHGFTRILTIYSHGFLLAHIENSTNARFFLAFFCFFLALLFLALFFSSLFFPRMREKNEYARKKKTYAPDGVQLISLDLN